MLATIHLSIALNTKLGEAEATKEDIARLKNKITETKVDILKWIVGWFLGIALAILGIYFKNEWIK